MVGSTVESGLSKLEDEDQAHLAAMDRGGTQPLRKGDSKFCLVCGDKALGYNFNAITCESCKAFFRRNALKTKEFRCPFDGDCKVDAVTRRFCQRCRLRKCFDVGMRKEWIMSDEEKVKKKQKIEANRVRRMLDGGGGVFPPPTTVATTTATSVPPSALYDHPCSQPSPAKMSRVSGDCCAVSPSDDVPDTKPLLLVSPPASGLTPSLDADGGGGEFGDDEEFAAPPHQHRRLRHADPRIRRCFEEAASASPSPPSSSSSSLGAAAVNGNAWTSSSSSSTVVVGDKRSYAASATSVPVGGGGGGGPGMLAPPPGAYYADRRSNEESGGSLMTALLSPAGNEGTCGGAASADGSFEFDDRGRMNGHSSSNGERSNGGNAYHLADPGSNPVGECSLHAGLPDQRRCRPLVDPLETVNSVLSVAIRAEFSAASLIGFNHNQKELNDAERAKIYELVAANEAMLSPIDVDASHKHCVKDPSLISVINMTDLAIRRIIKMSKRVNGFKNLCQEDQIALLKGGCTELMILRSVMTYDPEVNSWKIPHTSTPSIVKVDVLKKAGGNVYDEHQRFIRSFTPLWRNDENIMLVLGAITLFSPERPNVIHKDVVKLEQDSYYYLLKRYLESVLPGCEAKSQYLKLIHRVQELHYLNENFVRVYLDVNPKEVEPLLIEIFDLMRHQS